MWVTLSPPPICLQVNRQFMRVMVKTSKLSEVMYPQHLSQQVILNMPGLLLVSVPCLD